MLWSHKRYGLPIKEWYERQAENVTENEKIMLLWDVEIQTDKVIEYSRPNILLMDKGTRKCPILYIACSFDSRVKGKEKEKDQNREIKKSDDVMKSRHCIKRHCNYQF